MQNLRIYIVEDNPLLVRVLRHFLSGEGCTICGTSATYEKAIRDLELLQVDLVISDIMLESAKTGIDLGRYLNGKLGIPFIFQSSVSDTALINAALNLRPVAYLSKPVKRTELLSAINKSFSINYRPSSVG